MLREPRGSVERWSRLLSYRKERWTLVLPEMEANPMESVLQIRDELLRALVLLPRAVVVPIEPKVLVFQAFELLLLPADISHLSSRDAGDLLLLQVDDSVSRGQTFLERGFRACHGST